VSILIDRAKEYLETKIKNGEALTPLETDLTELIEFDSLSESSVEALKTRLKKMTLLSDGQVNPKTAKTLAGFEFENYILHLTPSNFSGVNLCPKASKGCQAACLNSAGRGRFDSVQFARLRKTLFFVKLKTQFLAQLDREIGRAYQSGLKNGVKVTIRLNGTSDIPFESLKVRDGLSLIELYQDVTFYDYTKIISRLERLKLRPLKNYSLTFSASESNESEVLKALSLGFNIAKVFNYIPETYQGREVLDGDSHDFRFLDKTSSEGFYIGLKAKGLAKTDKTGFVTILDVDKKTRGVA
jgi:hypothetical protein